MQILLALSLSNRRPDGASLWVRPVQVQARDGSGVAGHWIGGWGGWGKGAADRDYGENGESDGGVETREKGGGEVEVEAGATVSVAFRMRSSEVGRMCLHLRALACANMCVRVSMCFG